MSWTRRGSMDMARDLAHGDPWRESMERSLARRGRSADARTRPRDSAAPREIPTYWSLCWKALSNHGLTLVAGAAGVLSLALLSAASPGVSDGQSVRAILRSAPIKR